MKTLDLKHNNNVYVLVGETAPTFRLSKLQISVKESTYILPQKWLTFGADQQQFGC